MLKAPPAQSSTNQAHAPNKDTENFARLCLLLLQTCTNLLRDVLNLKISPTKLRSSLDKGKAKIIRSLSQIQKDILYPPSPNPSNSTPGFVNTIELDITLLYKILRNFGDIEEHNKGWGQNPSEDDYSLSACIERIRIYRNDLIAHSKDGQVNNATFENTWNILKDVVVELEKEIGGGNMYEREVNNLYNCDLNPSKAQEYTEKIKSMQVEVEIKRERLDILEQSQENLRQSQEAIQDELTLKQERLNETEERQLSLATKTTESLKAFEHQALQILKEQFTNLEQRLTKKISSHFELMEDQIMRKLEEMRDPLTNFETSSLKSSISAMDTITATVLSDMNNYGADFEEESDNSNTNTDRVINKMDNFEDDP